MALKFWLTDSLHRILPSTGREPALRPVLVARGERFSAQLAVRSVVPAIANHSRRAIRGLEKLAVVPVSVVADAASGLSVRIRRVGLVPVAHFNTPAIVGHTEGNLPGLTPDPLFDQTSATLWPNETTAFWITVHVAPDCRPGLRNIKLTMDAGERGKQRATLTLDVAKLTLKPRRDFPVTNWFYADALLDFYKLDGFTPRFWEIAGKYFRDIAEHGQDTLYVPIFTPPLDGVKRPTQLVKVARTGLDHYAFDWSDARKWVRLAARAGVRNFEFTHFFTQWGAANAIAIYHGQGEDERRLWPASTAATSQTYHKFLAQFLPELHSFCQAEGILQQSFFHTSDEPHGQEHRTAYAAARNLLHELAPWMKTMDALSDIDFARAGMVDMPIPSIRNVNEFLAADIPCWCYFCCGPRGKFLQRLMDTPLAKIRASGWLFYRTGVRGFLHWGLNYWYKSQTRQLIDPFTVNDGMSAPGWASGDPFLIYPGPEGPIDSVRWEVLADSLQDYALLQTIGVDRPDKLLAGFDAYDDFPFSPGLFGDLRRKLLRAAK